ncbi:Xylose operon regulatory protein [Sedimentisphaera cyanobacteriorum]|uniref:Xylose operon regulatory protein n=1 Tax=Sedimentisphaera cyanobacteriorum TaxID=1940790 RepID=A0A1Q2HLN1_9BACT|nr:DNA-binding transcriptional regulator [Sedimentisphaera cyanobacteriorum]AQQ08377.1 Xylose operon regulatory protein [Sedimentisphaera cyanobacteriorum]
MKQLLILVDTSRGPGRSFLSGVESYLRFNPSWDVLMPPPKYVCDSGLFPAKWCYQQNPDAMIVFGYYDIKNILSFNKPKVVMSLDNTAGSDAAALKADSKAIAQMASDYLFSLGHKRFGYCNCGNITWANERKTAFKEIIEQNGAELYSYNLLLSSSTKINRARKELSDWIYSLPKPISLLVCNDDIARIVLDACKLVSVSVPEEVSVLGVDNDSLICHLSRPALSSIELDFEGAGYRTLEHLDRIISGEETARVMNIEPVRIVTRQSTDMLAVEDSIVREALIFIRNNYQRKISVSDVTEHICFSRSALEKRFEAAIHRSVAGEITRLRIGMAKNKLLNSRLSVNLIASKFEFTNPQHFSRFFKNAVGITPDDFRKRYSKNNAAD